MFILQTLKDFLDNPMGKGSMAIMNRQLIKDDLNARYYKLIKSKKINEPVIYRDKDNYLFHFILPSETERDNTYDVLILFTFEEGEKNTEVTIDNYLVKFFSNSPSFTFTYAYAFNQYDLLIEFLLDKFGSEVIDANPIVRNPGEIVSYEKSIYFIGFHILLNKSLLLSKSFLNSHSKKLNIKDINRSVRNIEQIKIEIKNANNRLKKKINEIDYKKKGRLKKVIDRIQHSVPQSIINKITPRKKITTQKKISPTKSTLKK